MRKGILLVAFGTISQKSRLAYDNIDGLATERFHDTEIRWAYTSSFIRRKLAKQGKSYDSPLIALDRMREDGFTHVAVQSLHIDAGTEFHDLAKTARTYKSGPNAFDAIALGKPLLDRHDDMAQVVEATLRHLPERKPGDAVILMGHGNHHGTGNSAFPAAATAFMEAYPLAFLGTVAGHPTLDDVLELCRTHSPKRAFLVPFMSVAGDHARNDLAGDDGDSWKSALEELGIECVPVLTGLGEYDGVVDIWLDHLQNALDALD